MDINDFRSLSTVLVFIAFIGVCWWAFSPSRKKQFDDAANLPFSDDEINNLGSSKDASGDDKKKQD
ncbi:cbb3-type cytochrome c oxidase subunit 3 [Aestuariicella sp. G3-2]|uniref:cbb3-type cytochrome oxidase subunit 3 n=1 Tax=Pseudomaricurvus albidus TaxID=2842452 RepID=UPI001C0C517A|nr:cbb3-type cytochrome c oxidase subunit 3 [Aestuariicella albida]MBU3070127.1 cbb3-type cytochrome c oxidase subunit 3 [Aestuariicella albida]